MEQPLPLKKRKLKEDECEGVLRSKLIFCYLVLEPTLQHLKEVGRGVGRELHNVMGYL